MSIKLCMIAAITENLVIGKGGKLPWEKIPGDLQFFRETTMGSPVIMGRNTYVSLGKPLSGRLNIVLSNRTDALVETDDLKLFSDPSLALRYAYSKTTTDKVFIIGGGELYRTYLPLADELILNIVKGDYAGDVKFPPYRQYNWVVQSRVEHEHFTTIHLTR